jgi:hypothetical protein
MVGPSRSRKGGAEYVARWHTQSIAKRYGKVRPLGGSRAAFGETPDADKFSSAQGKHTRCRSDSSNQGPAGRPKPARYILNEKCAGRYRHTHTYAGISPSFTRREARGTNEREREGCIALLKYACRERCWCM